MIASAPCGPTMDLLTEIGPPADLSVEMLENLSQPTVGTLKENRTPCSVTACLATRGSSLEPTPGWDGGAPAGRDCRSASSPDVTTTPISTTTATTTAAAAKATRAETRRSSGASSLTGDIPLPCTSAARRDHSTGDSQDRRAAWDSVTPARRRDCVCRSSRVQRTAGGVGR